MSIDTIPAVDTDGNLRLDLPVMLALRGALSLEDMGVFSVQIARAAAARRPSKLQRDLLCVVGYHDEPIDRPKLYADIINASKRLKPSPLRQLLVAVVQHLSEVEAS